MDHASTPPLVPREHRVETPCVPGRSFWSRLGLVAKPSAILSFVRQEGGPPRRCYWDQGSWLGTRAESVFPIFFSLVMERLTNSAPKFAMEIGTRLILTQALFVVSALQLLQFR